MPRAPFFDDGIRPDPRKLAQAERIQLLRSVPLLAECTKRELRHLARSTRLVQIEPGQALITEGTAATEAYLVLAGGATVRKNRRKIAELGPGDVVGELALLLDRPRAATVVASKPLEVLALPRAELRSAIDDVPGLGWKLLQVVAARLET